MKKIILILSMFMSFFGFPQVGKVGVNTIAPTRELDVNGGLRVRALLDKSSDPTYSNIFAMDPNGNVDYVTKVSLAKDLNSANGEQNEPWYNVATHTGATSNTQTIYQNANVGIGDYSSKTGIGSKLEILGGGTSQLGLINASNFSKFDISKEVNALTIISRKTSSHRILGLFPDGSLYLGSKLLNDSPIGVNSGASFVYDATSKKLGIDIPISPGGNGLPTESLDLGGNARIRGLVDGNNKTEFSNFVVVKPNGTLGYSEGIKFSHSEVSTNSVVDFSNSSESTLKDLYFINAAATIILPNANNMPGRIQKFYIYGGWVDVRFRGAVFNAPNSNGFSPPTGISYSKHNGITQVSLSGNGQRFKLIEFYATQGQWFLNHQN